MEVQLKGHIMYSKEYSKIIQEKDSRIKTLEEENEALLQEIDELKKNFLPGATNISKITQNESELSLRNVAEALNISHSTVFKRCKKLFNKTWGTLSEEERWQLLTS